MVVVKVEEVEVVVVIVVVLILVIVGFLLYVVVVVVAFIMLEFPYLIECSSRFFSCVVDCVGISIGIAVAM